MRDMCVRNRYSASSPGRGPRADRRTSCGCTWWGTATTLRAGIRSRRHKRPPRRSRCRQSKMAPGKKTVVHRRRSRKRRKRGVRKQAICGNQLDMLIRPAEPDDAIAVARVHVRSWQAAYRTIVPDDYLSRLRPEDRAQKYDFATLDPQKPHTIVAAEDGLIHGFATTMPSGNPA